MSVVIRGLHLKRFKKFGELNLVFDAGLNVLIGNNEQGKSSVIDALIAGLFYSPESRASYVTALKSWGARALPSIEIDLEIDGVTFVLSKDFEEKYFLLRAADGSVSFDTVERGQAFLEEKLGIGSPDVFEATGCIRQDALAEIALNKQQLDASLERALTSAQVRVAASEVMKKIERKLTEMKKGIKTRVAVPGPLREVKDLLAAQEARLAEMHQKLEKAQVLRKELADLEIALATAEQELETKQQLFSGARTRLEATRRLAQLKKEFERMQSEIESRERLARDREYIREQIERIGPFSKQQLADAAQELAVIRGQLQSAQSRASQEVTAVPDEHTPRAWLFIGAGVSAALGLLGFFLSAVFFAAFAVAVGLAIAGVVVRSRHASARTSVRESAEARRREFDAEVAACQRQLSGVLGKFNCAEALEFDQKKRELEALLEKQQAVDSQLSLLATRQKPEELERERQTLLLEIGQQQQVIESGMKTELAPEAVAKLETEVGQLAARVAQLKQQITARDAVLRASDADPARGVALEEEVAHVRAREAQMEAQMEVLEVTRDAIARARESTLAKNAEQVTEFMRTSLPLITSGRYDHAVLGADLSVQVFSKEKGELVAPQEHLSQGTIEQIYLIARLALYRMVTGGKADLLILDDPFVNFDEARRTAVMKLLAEFAAAGQQILLCTHSDAYRSLGSGAVLEI